MDQMDLESIEKIIIRLIELKIVTANNNEQFFLENLEMNILINYIEEISDNLKRISDKLKKKYKNVPWEIIEKEKYVDDFFGSSMKIGKVYPLAKSLYDSLYDGLMQIISENIDSFNHVMCEKKHNEIKNSKNN